MSSGVIEDLKKSKQEKSDLETKPPDFQPLKFHQIDVNLLEVLLKLIEDRRLSIPETDEEYLEKKLQTIPNEKAKESGSDFDVRKDILFNIYMDFRKYETVVNQITAEYVKIRKIVRNLDMVRVFILILIVYLDEFSAAHVRDVLLKVNSSLTKSLVKFLFSYDLRKALCRYFDQTYVDEILKIKETRDILREMHRDLLNKDVEDRKSKIRKFKFKPFKTHYEKPSTHTQRGTEEESSSFVFQAKPVPYKILKVNTTEVERQREEKLKRRENNAKKLHEEANKKMFRVAKKIYKKKDASDATITGLRETEPVHKFQARKVQHFPPVEIKTNTTQTLREAAHIKREEEKFEKLIMGLTNGSLDTYEYENYIEELRKQREIEELENIERKKLQALITHEEAILARRRLIQNNKREKEEYCKQWEQYESKMNEIREKEMEELKLMFYVETKQRERNIQEKIKQVVDEKSKLVKEEQRKIREDEERRLEEIAEDIERKKELVRRIHLLRELAQLNNACRVVFDENEGNRNGFMYEMSLAELKERLNDMESEMKEELEQKRQEIIDERKAKQNLLQETLKLVQDTRNAKKERRKMEKEMKMCQKSLISVNENANQDLKLKLAQIRQERIALQKLDSKARAKEVSGASDDGYNEL